MRRADLRYGLILLVIVLGVIVALSLSDPGFWGQWYGYWAL